MSSERPTSFGRALRALVLASCALAVAPFGARAEIILSGTGAVTARGGEFQSRLNTMARGDNPFNPVRIHLFADARLDTSVSLLTEFLFDDGAPVRLQGAYIAVRPWSLPLEIEAGKIPMIVGLYPQRCYVDQNPLVGTPLVYQHQTILPRSARVPLTVSELLARRDSIGGLQQTGGGAGLPLVDETWWDSGIAVRGGGYAVFEYALGVTTGTVSSPRDVDSNDGKQILGRLAVRPILPLTIGASWAVGPWMDRAQLPADTAPDGNEYFLAGDLEFEIGHLEARAELARVRFDVPIEGVDELGVTAGYVEARYVLRPGLYGAARFDRMAFDHVDDGSGGRPAWDVDLSRIEGGVGYYLGRNVLLKAVYQGTAGAPGSRLEGWRGLYALQLGSQF